MCAFVCAHMHSILPWISLRFQNSAPHLEAPMHLLSFYNLPVTQQSANLLSTMCSTNHLITEKRLFVSHWGNGWVGGTFRWRNQHCKVTEWLSLSRQNLPTSNMGSWRYKVFGPAAVGGIRGQWFMLLQVAAWCVYSHRKRAATQYKHKRAKKGRRQANKTNSTTKPQCCKK